jgi:hypothetical protein
MDADTPPVASPLHPGVVPHDDAPTAPRVPGASLLDTTPGVSCVPSAGMLDAALTVPRVTGATPEHYDSRRFASDMNCILSSCGSGIIVIVVLESVVPAIVLTRVT